MGALSLLIRISPNLQITVNNRTNYRIRDWIRLDLLRWLKRPVVVDRRGRPVRYMFADQRGAKLSEGMPAFQA